MSKGAWSSKISARGGMSRFSLLESWRKNWLKKLRAYTGEEPLFAAGSYQPAAKAMAELRSLLLL